MLAHGSAHNGNAGSAAVPATRAAEHLTNFPTKVNRLVLLPVLAFLIGGCDHRTGVSSNLGRSGELTVVMNVVGTPNASLPLHLVVRDSRGHPVGEAPLSNDPQGWSFRLRPGAYRVVIVDGCVRRLRLGARAHVSLTVVLRDRGCRIRP